MSALDDLGDLGADDTEAGPAPASGMDAATFLRLVRPGAGKPVYAAAPYLNAKGEEIPHHYTRDTPEAAAALLHKRSSEGKNAYVAVCSFGNFEQAMGAHGAYEKANRRGENAVAARAWVVDLDVDHTSTDPKKSTSAETAIADLDGFCERHGLPRFTLNGSGYGVHAWLIVDADITPAEWLETAGQFEALAAHDKLRVDTSCTTDIARVLRVPGTLNHKNPDNPRPVVNLRHDGMWSKVEVRARIRAAHAALPESAKAKHKVLSRARGKAASAGGLVMVADELEPPALSALRAACPAYAQAVATVARQPEPVWRVMLSLTQHTKAGEAAAHKLSTLDSRYSVEETQAQLNSLKSFGPYTCTKVGQIMGPSGPCTSCPHRGGSTSPIHLARVAAQRVASEARRIALAGAVEGSNGGTLPDIGARPAHAVADVANGERFAAAARGRLLHLHDTNGWLRFDAESGWTAAATVAVEAFGKAVVGAMFDEAAEQWRQDREGSEAKKLRVNVERVSRLPHLRAMIETAKSEPGMSASLAAFDADPMLLGVRNGVVDLRTGELRQATPDLMVSKRCGVEYDRAADCPRFKAFLATTLPDPEVRAFVLRFIGYCLTGSVEEQVFAFLHGTGFNGKSVLVELVALLLGDYARKIPTEMLMLQQRSAQGPDPDILSLKGIRFAYASETEDGRRLSEARVKDLTGGESLTARAPYATAPVQFRPTFKLVISGQHRPTIADTSFGMWRRVLLVSFGVTIPEADRIHHLDEKLVQAEGPGILNAMLDGLRDWREGGLRVPASIKAATAAYRAEQDTLGEFVGDRCEAGTGFKVRKDLLYGEYRTWCEMNGHKPMSAHRLTRELGDRGFRKAPDRRHILGLRLTASGGAIIRPT